MEHISEFFNRFKSDKNNEEDYTKSPSASKSGAKGDFLQANSGRNSKLDGKISPAKSQKQSEMDVG